MIKAAIQYRHRRTSVLFAGVGLAALLGAATPAFAADAPAPAAPAAPAPAQAGTDTATPDIIVTARRVDEKLRDVPVAVSAFGARALAEQRINSEADLQIATPGLTVRATTSSNQLNYSIRGQSVDSYSYSAPAVVAYFNNVPVGGTTATAFFDLNSIQVLKGPQGTLFGRNATGGAVLYEATKPTEEFGGYLTAGYGNYNNREAEGAINIPIVPGVAIRLSGKDQQRDGYQNDLVNGTKLGALDNQVGRISLLIKPEGSGFENVLVYQRGLYRGTSTSLRIQNANGVNGAPSTYVDPGTGAVTPLNGGVAGAVYGDIGNDYPAGVTVSSPAINKFLTKYGINGIGSFISGYSNGKFGFYDVAPTQDSAHYASQDFVSNTTSYKLGSDATIKNIFGYNRVLSFDDTDLTGAPYGQLVIGNGPGGPIGSSNYNGGYTYGDKSFSDELQIAGTAISGKLKYVVGLFISNDKVYNRIPLAIAGDVTNCASNPNAAILCGGAGGAYVNGYLGSYDFQQKDISKAAYAQIGYEILPKLNFSAGIRVTKDDISITYPDPTGLNAAGGYLPASKSATKPSWLIGLDYKPSSDLLVYFNQRGSWRTGGYNGTAPGVNATATGPGNYPEAFLPETTYDFELGAKYASRLGDVPVSLNIAIYDQEISNVQRSPYQGLSAVAVNVPHARVRGTEIDGTVQPAHWLQFGGGFTYTDPKYTKNQTPFEGATFYFGPYGDTPKYTGSAFFRAATDLPGAAGEVALRGEVYAQSSFYYSNLANTTAPGTQLPGYALVNGRLEWNKINGSRVSLAAYVNNLTNKQYYTGGISLSSVEGENAALPGTPRMYGFDLTVKF